ncbi:uncharacterized protein LOC129871859 [Solanum dulcamara]|uniref:uncharacterized protein LOC129871859 n=1 Tax=Solanum dulcamara TaxID=45834 RepID=UPI00248647E5|nr:uncharacterized protein LOC129871859 [Solanum dulcamara]
MNKLREKSKSKFQVQHSPKEADKKIEGVSTHPNLPKVPSEIAIRVGHRISRILNWRVVVVKPKFETFMSTIFSEYQCSNIMQSQDEIESLVIPESEHHYEADTSTAKVKFTEPQEVPRFEDFSTKPPAELLKRSSHVADISSPPPPKRMKTTPGKKPIQVEKTKMDKDVIPPNSSEKSVSTSMEPVAKSGVCGESSGHSNQIIHVEFKALKKSIKNSLKKYVDRKFKRLEKKIDSNHTDILKAMNNIVHHMTGTSFPANKSDIPPANFQYHVQKDIKVDTSQAEPSNMIQEVDDVSGHNSVSDAVEYIQQPISTDTLKEAEPSNSIQQVDVVSGHNTVSDAAEYIQQHVSTDTLKKAEPSNMIQQVDDVLEHNIVSEVAESFQQHASTDTLMNNVMKNVIEVVDKTDQYEEHVQQTDKEKIKPTASESNTSAPISPKTMEVIDALIYGLPLPAKPLTIVSHEQVVLDECLLRDIQLPTTLPSKPDVLPDDAKTPLLRTYRCNIILSSEEIEDVVGQSRLIRVYDSSTGRRTSNPSPEIQKIEAKSPGNMLESHHPFAVEYVEGIAQQESDSLDCGIFLASFFEYLSDGSSTPTTRLQAEFFRERYGALLWKYGCWKSKDGYVRENDDQKKPKRDFISPSQGEPMDVE